MEVRGKGVVVLRARSELQETRGRSGFEWMSLHRCVKCDLGARYLLRQDQYQNRRPVRFPGPQGTWESTSAENLGVQPSNRDYNPDINPTLNVKNGFIHFRGYELTQSGGYNLGLLALSPINQEEKWRKMFPLVL